MNKYTSSTKILFTGVVLRPESLIIYIHLGTAALIVIMPSKEWSWDGVYSSLGLRIMRAAFFVWGSAPSLG